MTRNLRSLGIAGIGLCVLAAASTAPAGDDAAATGDNGVSDSEALSAEALGDMHVVVKAGPKDGELVAFVLSPDWADGEIIKTLSEKDDLNVNSAEPDGASQYDINAGNRLKSTDRAPKVFDLGQAVALASEDMSAPYQVKTGDGIPKVDSLDDLLRKGSAATVVLNVDPTQAGTAIPDVVTGTASNGGPTDNVPSGVEYFRKSEDARRQPPVDPTPPTVQSDQTSPSSPSGTTPTPP